MSCHTEDNKCLAQQQTLRRFVVHFNMVMSKATSVPSTDGCEESEALRTDDNTRTSDILYSVDDRPPVILCVVLAFQQFLTLFGATFSLPLLMSRSLCIADDYVGLSQLISTVIFVAGFSTLLQTTFGIRLPIVQSISYSFVPPFMILLSLPEWSCPYTDTTNTTGIANATNLPKVGSDAHREMWQARLRELQGALMVSSIFQIVVSFSGLMGLLMRFIGPLTITPTISLIGMSLFDTAAEKSQGHWWIALMTLALVAIFSQYLRDVQVPFCQIKCTKNQRSCERSRLTFFSLFPVLLAVILSWLLCFVLTETGVLPDSPSKWGYRARTDTRTSVLAQASWFRFPYPGQWGVPTVSVAGVFGSLAAIIASMVESVGDYVACARLSGAPSPPGSAVSRGLGMEGLTCLLAGAWGSCGGTTSYSENIGAIGITKVGSRVVIQVTAILMLILGCIGKFSAIFVTIPDPVIGGLFLAMFGMITAVGLSNLQYVDLNSTRNLFVIGISFFLGIAVPKWIAQPANMSAIDTGSAVVDQIFSVLCGTSMFLGGLTAFILDNTIPGSTQQRGTKRWRESSIHGMSDRADIHTYDLPRIQPWLNKMAFTSKLPFCPGFTGDWRHKPKTLAAKLNAFELVST